MCSCASPEQFCWFGRGNVLTKGPPLEDSIFWVNVFPATCYRGAGKLLAQPAIRVRAHWSQPIMTFPYRQAGKRARPIYQTDRSPCGGPPRDGYGSRAVFQNRFHSNRNSVPFLVHRL